MSATLIILGALALLAGIAVLVVDARKRAVRTRVRREWAGQHSARYAAADPVVTGQWYHGVFARGPGRALDLVSRELDGRRLYLFDLAQGDAINYTVLALRRPTSSHTTLELRLGTSTATTGAQASQRVDPEQVDDEQVTSEAGMDLLGHVGTRYAFTDDLEAARRAVDERLVLLADDVGDDVAVLWAEGCWVLAAVESTAGPQRWEEVAAALGRFADLVRLLPPASPARDVT